MKLVRKFAEPEMHQMFACFVMAILRADYRELHSRKGYPTRTFGFDGLFGQF